MLLTTPQLNNYASKQFSTPTTFGTDSTIFPEKYNLFKYYRYRHFHGNTANRCSNFPLVKNLILAVVCSKRILPLVHSSSLKLEISLKFKQKLLLSSTVLDRIILAQICYLMLMNSLTRAFPHVSSWPLSKATTNLSNRNHCIVSIVAIFARGCIKLFKERIQAV